MCVLGVFGGGQKSISSSSVGISDGVEDGVVVEGDGVEEEVDDCASSTSPSSKSDSSVAPWLLNSSSCMSLSILSSSELKIRSIPRVS